MNGLIKFMKLCSFCTSERGKLCIAHEKKWENKIYDHYTKLRTCVMCNKQFKEFENFGEFQCLNGKCCHVENEIQLLNTTKLPISFIQRLKNYKNSKIKGIKIKFDRILYIDEKFSIFEIGKSKKQIIQQKVSTDQKIKFVKFFKN